MSDGLGVAVGAEHRGMWGALASDTEANGEPWPVIQRLTVNCGDGCTAL